MYKIIYCIFFISYLTSGVKVNDLKIYYDENNINQHLYRAKINSNNTYISAETHTHAIQATKKINNDNTIIFKINDNNNKANYIKTDKDKIYKNCLVEWSPYIKNKAIPSSELFYSARRECEEKSGKDCKKWNEVIEYNKIEKWNQSNRGDTTCTVINDKLHNIEDALTDSESITKYILSTPTTKEINNSLFEHRNKFPIIHILYDDKEEAGFNSSFSTNHSRTKLINVKDYETITDFDVKMTYDEFNNPKNRYIALFNEKHSTYQNRIYFTCQTETQKSISLPLYPNKSSENADQIEPRFNHDGTKASFLSFQPNSNGHFMLYVVDLNISDGCAEFIFNNKNNTEKLNYTKIDDFIVNDDYKDGYPNQRFTSYCWHPSKNILFYIKRDKINNDDSFKNYSIYYYDLDKKDGPHLLDIPTNYNSYLSISNDGQYLLFSFTSLKSGYSNKNIFSNTGNIKMNAYNKIGLAKLTYD